MGPKPTLHVTLKPPAQASKLTISSATLFTADDPDGEFVKFREMGPQRFEVRRDHLFVMAYGFPKYLKVEVELSDGKVYRSNVFQPHGLRSFFDMTIAGEGVWIKPSKDGGARYLIVRPR